LFDRPAPEEARQLIEAQGLAFEPGYDDLVGVYEEGRLVACGARAGYVLKMVAIEPGHQGGDTLGELVTGLIRSGLAAGQDSLFVFTRPQLARTFEHLNFRLLASHGAAALLEYGPGLAAWLADQAGLVRPGRNGAVVVNGNPFTLGHLHLVETAAREVDRLYLFVVGEDVSVVPFADRLRLAAAATAHLANVTVLGSSRYAVSAGTFPAYFLRRADQVAQAQIQLDLRLFAQHLAPAFQVACRFVGEEPLCPATAAYNRAMAEVLPEYGLGLRELPRLEVGGSPVSAGRVRRLLADCDFGTLGTLVPPATLDYLGSPAGQAVAARIRTQLEGA